MAKPNNAPVTQTPGKEQAPQDLITDLKSEISVEAAPLMTFILTNARTIALFLAAFLIVVAGYGGWRWYGSKAAADSHAELGRVITAKQGQEKAEALEKIAAGGGGGAARLSTLLELGNTWLGLGNQEKAAEAFKELAKADSGGALGSIAALNEAEALVKAGKKDEALAAFESAEKMVPESGRNAVRNMMAEAAVSFGEYKRALDIFNTIAASSSGPDVEYYRFRIQEIEALQAKTAGNEKTEK